MSLAKITILGNMTRDGESKYTPAGAMNHEINVAVNTRRGQDESVAYYRCTAWGKLAEVLDGLRQNGALAKGQQVLVIGDLRPREYQDKQGQPRMSLDVVADTVQLVGGRGERQADGADQSVPF